MTLQGCGWQPASYRIDAVDISSRALALAAEGVYGSNSFRGTDLAFRDIYFAQTAQGWRLNDGVRENVHFQQANILAQGFMPGEALYDIVFCRNLLIYFDRATQERVVAMLRRLLKPHGVLFVGSSETGLLITLGFVLEKFPQAYALRLPAVTVAATPVVPEQRRPVLPSANKKTVRVPRVLPSVAPLKRQEKNIAPVASPTRDPLAEAMQLADQGRVREAVNLCDSYVRKHGMSAQSCHLMGLLSKAAGHEADAVAYFRKALYLDPRHPEAMSHLAMLLEKQGDGAGAQVLRNRLRRLGDAPAGDRGDAWR
jgi:chemotaxis protein methyltransferase WspC